MSFEYYKSITDKSTLFSYCSKCLTVCLMERCVDIVIINNELGELVIGQSMATDKCLTCGHEYDSFKDTW